MVKKVNLASNRADLLFVKTKQKTINILVNFYRYIDIVAMIPSPRKADSRVLGIGVS